MKKFAEVINPSFAKCLQEGIEEAPKGTKFVAVHVSSWHMAIFYEWYSNCQDMEKAVAQPLLDPMCYSQVKLVWEIEGQQLVFCDAMGLVSAAHDYWEENKDNPDAVEAKCVGNVKDILDPQPTHPNVKKDHICQADPGETKCYFCDGPVAPIDTSNTTLNILK